MAEEVCAAPVVVIPAEVPCSAEEVKAGVPARFRAKFPARLRDQTDKAREGFLTRRYNRTLTTTNFPKNNFTMIFVSYRCCTSVANGVTESGTRPLGRLGGNSCSCTGGRCSSVPSSGAC